MANLEQSIKVNIKDALSFTDNLIKEAAYMGMAFGLAKVYVGKSNSKLLQLELTDTIGEIAILDRSLLLNCMERVESVYATIGLSYMGDYKPVSNFLDVFGLIDTIGVGIIENINQHIDYFNKGMFAATLLVNNNYKIEKE